jgi:hypothetical protein
VKVEALECCLDTILLPFLYATPRLRSTHDLHCIVLSLSFHTWVAVQGAMKCRSRAALMARSREVWRSCMRARLHANLTTTSLVAVSTSNIWWQQQQQDRSDGIKVAQAGRKRDNYVCMQGGACKALLLKTKGEAHACNYIPLGQAYHKMHTQQQ